MAMGRQRKLEADLIKFAIMRKPLQINEANVKVINY